MKRDFALCVISVVLSFIFCIGIIILYCCNCDSETYGKILICIFGGIFGSSLVLFVNKLIDLLHSEKNFYKDLYKVLFEFYRVLDGLYPFKDKEILNIEYDVEKRKEFYISSNPYYFIDQMNYFEGNSCFVSKKNKEQFKRITNFVINEATCLKTIKSSINNNATLTSLINLNHLLFEQVVFNNEIYIYSWAEKYFLDDLSWVYKQAYGKDTTFFIGIKGKESIQNESAVFRNQFRQYNPYEPMSKHLNIAGHELSEYKNIIQQKNESI